LQDHIPLFPPYVLTPLLETKFPAVSFQNYFLLPLFTYRFFLLVLALATHRKAVFPFLSLSSEVPPLSPPVQ